MTRHRLLRLKRAGVAFGQAELLRLGDLGRAGRLADRGVRRAVRWIHSRAAGVDNLLFPELVNSEILLTNGSGVFSQSVPRPVVPARAGNAERATSAIAT